MCHPMSIGSGHVRAKLLPTERRMLSFPVKENRSVASEVTKFTVNGGTISARWLGRVDS